MSTIGNRIKTRRTELGYTQEDLAKKMGYKNRSTVNKIEKSDNLPLRKVGELAKILQVTPSYLMGWDMEFTQNNNQGTISNNIGSDTGHNMDSNNSYTTNNYYSSPCEKHAVNHEIEATINSKECFFKVLDCLRDMTDEQLLEVLKYSEYVLNKKR